MKLEECYNAFGGSYQEVRRHLVSENAIQRLVIMFLSDKSYDNLNKALQEKNYKEAFCEAHTLKGVSLNLCFRRLSASISVLTELLRNCDSEQVDEEICRSLWQQVSKEYLEVTDAVRRFSEESKGNSRSI